MKLPRLLFGVPIHPMLVHFPVAFWLAVPVFDALSLIVGPGMWWSLSVWVTAIGVAIGVFAIITGFMEYLHRADVDVSVRLAASHGVRTTLAWFLFSGKLIVILLTSTTSIVMVICLLIDLLACGILIHGVFLGTRLAYRTGSG